MLELARALYTGVDICMHSTWYHLLQSSHATSPCFQVTALQHTWQGYFGALGPGLDYISDAFDRSRRLRYRRVCCPGCFANLMLFNFRLFIKKLMSTSRGLVSFLLILDVIFVSWLFLYTMHSSKPNKINDLVCKVSICLHFPCAGSGSADEWAGLRMSIYYSSILCIYVIWFIYDLKPVITVICQANFLNVQNIFQN
jgi:hypothetical protein